METQFINIDNNNETKLLNRNSTDNIRISSPIFNEQQQQLQQQEQLLKQQLLQNQQQQKLLQEQILMEQQQQLLRQQQLLQLQQDESDVKKGVTRTSFFVAAARAILTNKYISLLSKQLHNSQQNINTSTNEGINQIKEIENINKLKDKGYYIQDLIPESDLSFIKDQLCTYDPFAIFYLDTEEAKQLLLDSYQLFFSILPQQPYFNIKQHNSNTYNNNKNNLNSSNNSLNSSNNNINNNNNLTFQDFILKSHPVQSWFDFQNHKTIKRVAFRTKYIDQIIMDGLSQKGSIANLNATAFFYTQVVICGAGLDSRALRLPIPKHASVFEIDLPQVIEFKKRVLEKSTQVIKPHSQCKINHISGDIVKEGDRWISSLLDAGFNPAMHTLWVMEGLLMYLTEEEIGTLLGAVGMLSAPNSKLLIHTVAPFKKSSGAGGSGSNIAGGSLSPSLSSSTSTSSSSAFYNYNNNNQHQQNNTTYNFFKEEFVSYHSNPIELLTQFGFSKDITSVSYSDLNQMYQCNDPDFIKGADYSKFSTGLFTG
ncbi:hypothetical protein DICPUDRAFT_50193 [Dictyostelium purpureum]|uniref:[Phosphatase 2A protein]-leucine-carboxy methyltransferase 1 n=1 Tax=Dictyostelium purpureum TaxID=5786 RepID=F0ZX84_DICPU|nr:uncharacterized protein DICPUDRAFT_50193 [Dictyostelium purpureum]EGC31459.1 hypothetical protein DICPUDRAFT_50193 [Dictyostelium purpureum]|eukprot:XP_003292028.1 hypothetical protein DICPUDRAFT_50193 [Dictyostelium purpureum]